MTFIATSAQFSKILSFIFLFAVFLIQPSNAQVEESSELYIELVEKDSILFDEGFNECNITATEQLISENLEFYHDVAGVSNKEGFLNSVRENICSGAPKKPIRKLVEGSLEVFSLRNQGEIYGAIQKGIHEFFIKEPGRELYQTGVAAFTHLWILEEGSWKLKTVLSYDHQGPK